MNTTGKAYWSQRSRRRRLTRLLARLSIVPTAMLAMMIGALGLLALQQSAFGTWLAPAVAPPDGAGPVSISHSFAPCGFVRITCVVDGDTFWLEGIKYRIADINTPEVSSPQCAREADLGRRATDRLAQLLSAGPFTLSSVDRDQDQYGRTLRVVARGGHSLGMTLVAEGLAHEWQGYRQSWC